VATLKIVSKIDETILIRTNGDITTLREAVRAVIHEAMEISSAALKVMREGISNAAMTVTPNSTLTKVTGETRTRDTTTVFLIPHANINENLKSIKTGEPAILMSRTTISEMSSESMKRAKGTEARRGTEVPRGTAVRNGMGTFRQSTTLKMVPADSSMAVVSENNATRVNGPMTNERLMMSGYTTITMSHSDIKTITSLLIVDTTESAAPIARMTLLEVGKKAGVSETATIPNDVHLLHETALWETGGQTVITMATVQGTPILGCIPGAAQVVNGAELVSKVTTTTVRILVTVCARTILSLTKTRSYQSAKRGWDLLRAMSKTIFPIAK